MYMHVTCTWVGVLLVLHFDVTPIQPGVEPFYALFQRKVAPFASSDVPYMRV